MKKIFLITTLLICGIAQPTFAQNTNIEVIKESYKKDLFNGIFDQVRNDSTTNKKVSEPNTATYQTELKKLNEYLKTFDNGYYGYLEVKDGFIYMHYKSGNYKKFNMKDVGNAEIDTYYKKVSLSCNGSVKCMEANWNPKGEDGIDFRTNKEFDYQTLATLLNNFKNAFLGNPNSTNVVNSNVNQTEKPTSKIQSYQNQLNQLNEYLKTFHNGFYGPFEVADGYIILRMKGEKFNKFKMQDMDKAEILSVLSKNDFLKFKCKDNKECMEVNWLSSKKDSYIGFQTYTKPFDYQVLQTLINNFFDAYLGKSFAENTTNTNISNTNSQTTPLTLNPNATNKEWHLEQLNNYLKSGKMKENSSEFYFEINNNFVYRKRQGESDFYKFNMQDVNIVKKTVSGNNFVLIVCKYDSQCNTTISGSGYKQFGFNAEKDNDDLYILLSNFRYAYLNDMPVKVNKKNEELEQSQPSLAGTLILFYTGRGRPAVVHGFTIFSKGGYLPTYEIERIVDELRSKHGDKLTSVGFNHYTFVPGVDCSKAMSSAGRKSNGDGTYSDDDYNSIYCLDPYIVKE